MQVTCMCNFKFYLSQQLKLKTHLLSDVTTWLISIISKQTYIVPIDLVVRFCQSQYLNILLSVVGMVRCQAISIKNMPEVP